MLHDDTNKMQYVDGQKLETEILVVYMARTEPPDGDKYRQKNTVPLNSSTIVQILLLNQLGVDDEYVILIQ